MLGIHRLIYHTCNFHIAAQRQPAYTVFNTFISEFEQAEVPGIAFNETHIDSGKGIEFGLAPAAVGLLRVHKAGSRVEYILPVLGIFIKFFAEKSLSE